MSLGLNPKGLVKTQQKMWMNPAFSPYAPLPNALPFPATDANRGALQNWRLDRYRYSKANTPPTEGLAVGTPSRFGGQADRSPQTHSGRHTLTR